MQYQTRLIIAEARIKLDESQVTLFTSKTFQVMQQHIYYIRYALRFADMQISELVSVFNDQEIVRVSVPIGLAKPLYEQVSVY